MIYNKETVARIIKDNIENLNNQLKVLLMQFKYNELDKMPKFNHLVAWKAKNVNSLAEWGHITSEEMDKFNSSNDYLFTPEIKI